MGNTFVVSMFYMLCMYLVIIADDTKGADIAHLGSVLLAVPGLEVVCSIDAVSTRQCH